MSTTLDLQRRLSALGYDPGPLDGIPGRRTTPAVVAFQIANGLEADGIAGPKTIAALNAAPGIAGGVRPAILGAPPLPWYEEARRHLGLCETAGPETNRTISEWLKRLRAAWSDDETPWCGTFAGWCIAATLAREPLPANPFGARNWLKFGAPCQPRRGAVLVFSRPGSAWSGHVGFYAGEDGEAFHVLGGNQSNSVTIARMARTRLLGARWPRTAPPSAAGRVRAAATTPFSRNEA